MKKVILDTGIAGIGAYYADNRIMKRPLVIEEDRIGFEKEEDENESL